MDTRKIRKLIELVKETGIGELEVKSGEESVRISQPGQQIMTQAHAPQIIHQATAAPGNQPTASPPASENVPKQEPPESANGHTVRSPMVGTAYISPTPGANPFVNIGDRIKVGDTLCLIEAMKMFNKIEADKAGVVSARLIDNQNPVEYDQPLFIIEAD